MQSCCVFECDSYKSTNSKKISYFKFPSHDDAILKQWLAAINQPNWTPNNHTQICEIHFNPDDIEKPFNKYPYLKSDVVPTIFPRRNIFPQFTDIKQSQRMDTPVVENNPKTEITLLSPVLQATPVILTPSLIDQLPAINQTLVPVSNSPQRFRKILPKLAQNSTDSQQNQTKRKESLPNPSNAAPNPYIIIIPTFDNTKSSVAQCTPPKLLSQSSKKPILKITVGRRLREDEYLLSSKKNNEGTDVNNQTETDKGKSHDEDINNKDEEIVFNNYSLKKSVVYTLDSVSGKIKVSHRPLEYSSEPISKVSDSNNETSRRITRSSTKENKTSAEIISQLKETFLKTQQDPDELIKQKLMMLRPVHEADEIERLEKELLKYGNSVNNDNKSNNKLQENKRRLSCSYEEESNSKEKVFILENLLKKNEIIIKKMKTPSITNGQVFITKSLPSKESSIFYSQNMDKNNHLLKSNSVNPRGSTGTVSNNCII